jgi:hypothetical protein
VRRKLIRFGLLLVSPLLCLTLLGGIAAENRTYLKPADFEPYHVRGKAAIQSLPMSIGSWNGSPADDEVPKEAQTLLKPNIILMRRYSDVSVAGLDRPRSVSLLIVQCKQSGDMIGHFPPVCYPSAGNEQKLALARDWKITPEVTIPGMEYQFVWTKNGQTIRKTVYNFMIVPTRGMVRDMEGIKQAAQDYQQRYYGAAQFQVVFSGPVNGDLEQSERDEIFKTLMEPAIPVITVLNDAPLASGETQNTQNNH